MYMNLKRVEFEYDDGSVKFIEGKELEKWNSYNAIVAQLASSHGMNPPWEDVNWTNYKKYKSVENDKERSV